MQCLRGVCNWTFFRVAPIINFPRPKNLKDVMHFIGMMGYYARFIPRFAEIAAPLHSPKRKNQMFTWKEDQEKAFCTFKHELASAPALHVVDFTKSLCLHVDASATALGAVLGQCWDEGVRPVTFACHLLTDAERKLGAYEEALAYLFGVERFATYLESKEFDLYMDNRALSWIFNHPQKFGKLGRWVYRLLKFRFKIHHVSGKENEVAESLSRMYDIEEFHVRDVAPECTVSMFTPSHQVYCDLKVGHDEDPLCKQIHQDILAGVQLPYAIHDGFVVHTGVRGRAQWIVVPVSFQPMILSYFHALVYGGYMGVLKTFQKVAGNFYRPTMTQDVTTFVRACKDCQQLKPPHNSKVGMHNFDTPSFLGNLYT